MPRLILVLLLNVSKPGEQVRGCLQGCVVPGVVNGRRAWRQSGPVRHPTHLTNSDSAVNQAQAESLAAFVVATVQHTAVIARSKMLYSLWPVSNRATWYRLVMERPFTTPEGSLWARP